MFGSVFASWPEDSGETTAVALKICRLYRSSCYHHSIERTKCKAALTARGVKSTSSIEVGNDVVGSIMEVVAQGEVLGG
jgi:hypothetical protein